MSGRIEVMRLSSKYQFVLFVEWQGDNKEIMVAEDPKGNIIFCKHQMGCWCEIDVHEDSTSTKNGEFCLRYNQ